MCLCMESLHKYFERDICYQSTSRSLLALQMHASQSPPFKSAHTTRISQSDPSKPPDRWNPDSPCHSCTVLCFDQSVTSSIKKKILYDAADIIYFIVQDLLSYICMHVFRIGLIFNKPQISII